MRVKELIEALSKFNGDTEICFKYKDEEISMLDGADGLDLRVKCLISRISTNVHEEPTCLIEVDEFDD